MTNSNHIQDEIVEEVDTDLIPELEDSIQDSDIKIDDITEKDKDRRERRYFLVLIWYYIVFCFYFLFL